MPLADFPPLRISPPPSISQVRGRKASSILNILDKTATGYAKKKDTNYDLPTNMSDEQMLAYYKLCLYNYVDVSNGKRHDISKGTHSSYVVKTATRTELARYTTALLEGMVRLLFRSVLC